MSVATLALSGGVQLVTGVAFALVGRAIWARDVPPSTRFASHAFASFWLALAGYLVLQAALAFAGVAGAVTVGALVLTHVVSAALFPIALWGLSAYLAYLFRGTNRWAPVLAVLYAAMGIGYAALWWVYEATGPRIGDWLVTTEFARPLDGRYRALLAAFAAPPLVGSILYLTLLPRLRSREQRWRVVLLSSAILLYIGTGLAVRVGEDELLKALNITVLGLLTAGVALAAFHPPRIVRRWLGAADGVPVGRGPRPEDLERRRAAFASRARELL